MATFEEMLDADPRSAYLSAEEKQYIMNVESSDKRSQDERQDTIQTLLNSYRDVHYARIAETRTLPGTENAPPDFRPGPDFTPTPAPPSANFYTPPPPPAPRTTPVRPPERSLTVFADDTALAKEISRLYYQQINALSLAVIERHDTIEGQNPYYKIISNLSSIKSELDPITVLARQRATLRPGDFGKGIFLFEKLDTNNPYIYIDDDPNSQTFGNLIIELINLAADEEVQIQIAGNGTIYEIEEVD